MTVDLNLLSADEADEYAKLVDAKAALPGLYKATGWRLPGYVWGVMAAWFFVWAGCLALVGWWAIATAVRPPTGGYKIALPLLILGLVVLAAGAVFPVFWTGHDHKRISARLEQAQGLIDEFLARIDYDGRVKRAQYSGYSEDNWTLRQSQHAWYGTHSELDWRHRVQGQALGFTNAHEYVNNFLESE